MIKNANSVANWATTEILKYSSSKGRAYAITHFINVLTALHQFNNFNGVVQMLSCLYSSTIAKLKDSWKLVPKKEMELLENLQKLMNNSNHYKAYHDQLNTVPSHIPCIPLIGTYFIVDTEGLCSSGGVPRFASTR